METVASNPEKVLLRATGLCKAFVGQRVLDSINLELKEGEVVLLKGENGSGKTTLINIITGNVEPDAGVVEYRIGGRETVRNFPRGWTQDLNPLNNFTPEYVAHKGLGRTWQEVRLFNSHSLSDNVAVASLDQPGENPLKSLMMPIRTAKQERENVAKAHQLLATLGLKGREESSADKVSLGQSKRVAIARAISAGAKVLFLDEPLAGLDRNGICDVVNLLHELVSQHKFTLIIVEHVFNQNYLESLVTTQWLLKAGKLTSTKTSELSVSDVSSSVAHPDHIISVLLKNQQAEVLSEDLTRGAVLTRIRRRDLFSKDAEIVLDLQDLVVKRGGRKVIGFDSKGDLSGFNLKVQKGEIVILQAPNGWGKTTLFECIAGANPHVSGSIDLAGTPLRKQDISARARLGLTFVRSADNVFNSLTAHEMLRLHQSDIEKSELDSFPNKRISDLSGGQRQRLAVAVLKQSKSSTVCLFDEPFSMLDASAIAEVSGWLQPTLNSATVIAVPLHSR